MRAVVEVVEIDIPYCALLYGTTNGAGTCPAVLGVDSAIKCYQTTRTCPVRPSFVNVPVTLTFTRKDVDYAPAFLNTAIPSLLQARLNSATVSVGENLGERATLTVTFEDHPHPDTGAGFDKYVAERPYDPMTRGTFWGRFRARHHQLRGAKLRWRIGTTEMTSLSQYETRHYIVDSINGPTTSGSFQIIAKDILKQPDGDRAQAPVLNSGFLQAGISAVATSFTALPVGVGNQEYSASGKLALGGREIVSFTRVGDAFTITRAQNNTVAVAHDAQDRVQQVLSYSGKTVAFIIHDLLTNYAGVDPSYIDLPTWEDEVNQYLGAVYSAVIAEPTSVKDLIDEQVLQAALIVWWDDLAQLIRLNVLRGVVPETATLDNDNTIIDSIQIRDQPEKRKSQVWVWYGQINPLDGDNDKNYRSAVLTVDQETEADYGSASIEIIKSRWIAAGGRTIAQRLGEIRIGRYKNPPRLLSFAAQRFSMEPIQLGRAYSVGSFVNQDATGALIPIIAHVTRMEPSGDKFEAEAEELLWSPPATDLALHPITFDSNISNANLRTTYDALYPPPQTGDVVTVTISAGVIIGSTSTSIPGLDIGTWPPGVTINFVNLGRVQGAGGNGAYDTSSGSFIATPGGPALYTRYAINLNNSAGQIWSGGGGGGLNVGGAAGGGGAGQQAGLGGITSYWSATGPEQGHDGTTEIGGAGGTFGAGTNGGAGGNPGQSGGTGNSGIPGGKGFGAAAGASIDGVSFVTTIGGAGSRLGAQIN